MGKPWRHAAFQNKNGQVRSGWVLLLALAAFYGLRRWLPRLFAQAAGRLQSPAARSMALQALMDLAMLAVPLVAWRGFMKRPLREMGLPPVREAWKDASAGMLLGAASCTLVLAALLWAGQARVGTWKPAFHPQQLWWALAFVLVAFAEETLSRAFIMATLRRAGSLAAAMLLPSVFFGLIHGRNPGVTAFSMLNIMLVGLLFSYMFVKSGNVWMCIGYHFTWNTFQGVVYGMPVSGLSVPGLVAARFPAATLLNGGRFGIEGGLLTTLAALLGFGFVAWYYRGNAYDFISDTKRLGPLGRNGPRA